MQQKRTQIIASIGRTLHTAKEFMEAMKCGANGFRLALGLSDRDHLKDAQQFLCARQEMPSTKAMGEKVGLYLDCPATRPRIGQMPDQMFHPGDNIQVIDATETSSEGIIPLPGLSQWISKLDSCHRLMFRDGRNIFNISAITSDMVSAKCILSASPLEASNGCSFPDSGVQFDLLREEDLRLFANFAQANIKPDAILLSFPTSALQIKEARREIIAIWPKEPPRIIAKIETPYAYENAYALAEEADGILLGRGDLGISVSPQRLPRIQKQLVMLAKSVGKSIAVATQFLENYASTGVPNRAELNDVALAAWQGVNEIVLCQETSNSPYAMKAIALASEIIKEEDDDKE